MAAKRVATEETRMTLRGTDDAHGPFRGAEAPPP